MTQKLNAVGTLYEFPLQRENLIFDYCLRKPGTLAISPTKYHDLFQGFYVDLEVVAKS